MAEPEVEGEPEKAGVPDTLLPALPVGAFVANAVASAVPLPQSVGEGLEFPEPLAAAGLGEGEALADSGSDARADALAQGEALWDIAPEREAPGDAENDDDDDAEAERHAEAVVEGERAGVALSRAVLEAVAAREGVVAALALPLSRAESLVNGETLGEPVLEEERHGEADALLVSPAAAAGEAVRPPLPLSAPLALPGTLPLPPVLAVALGPAERLSVPATPEGVRPSLGEEEGVVEPDAQPLALGEGDARALSVAPTDALPTDGVGASDVATGVLLPVPATERVGETLGDALPPIETVAITEAVKALLEATALREGVPPGLEPVPPYRDPVGDTEPHADALPDGDPVGDTVPQVVALPDRDPVGDTVPHADALPDREGLPEADTLAVPRPEAVAFGDSEPESELTTEGEAQEDTEEDCEGLPEAEEHALAVFDAEVFTVAVLDTLTLGLFVLLFTEPEGDAVLQALPLSLPLRREVPVPLKLAVPLPLARRLALTLALKETVVLRERLPVPEALKEGEGEVERVPKLKPNTASMEGLGCEEGVPMQDPPHVGAVVSERAALRVLEALSHAVTDIHDLVVLTVADLLIVPELDQEGQEAAPLDEGEMVEEGMGDTVGAREPLRDPDTDGVAEPCTELLWDPDPDRVAELAVEGLRVGDAAAEGLSVAEHEAYCTMEPGPQQAQEAQGVGAMEPKGQ